MESKRFGKTGWEISSICLGTVELGMKYGFYNQGEEHIPNESRSIDILLSSFNKGVNFVDTAPSYGNSEEIVGKALKEWKGKIYLATKIESYTDKPSKFDLKERVETSILKSLKYLNIEYIDLLQLHSLNINDDTYLWLLDILSEYIDKGIIRALGASIYTEEEGIVAVNHELISMVQLQYNLLDQRMNENILALAAKRDVAILSRSTFLKGVLTSRFDEFNDKLKSLNLYVNKARTFSESYGEELSSMALRFCLSNEKINSVLVGIRNKNELDFAIDSYNKGKLSPLIISRSKGLAVDNDLVDPRFWGIE